MGIEISFDPVKRERTLQERCVDFLDAGEVLSTAVYQQEDKRRDYGEKRIICFGLFQGRAMVVGYVRRGEIYHVFSMRKANERELNAYYERSCED